MPLGHTHGKSSKLLLVFKIVCCEYDPVTAPMYTDLLPSLSHWEGGRQNCSHTASVRLIQTDNEDVLPSLSLQKRVMDSALTEWEGNNSDKHA